MDAQPGTIAVFLESGRKRVFASAIDWPGWARSGKSEELALATLAEYLPRYEVITGRAGLTGPAGPLAVTERHEGVARNADFGALGEIAPAEHAPLTNADSERLAALAQAAWATFDEAAASAPEELRKGPRGGGRTTSRIVDHVSGCEAAYARKIGVTLPKAERSGHDGLLRLRALIVAGLLDPPSLTPPDKPWPLRYAVRRGVWHVLDHLWEIEDKSGPA
jgi:hypothetical protein